MSSMSNVRELLEFLLATRRTGLHRPVAQTAVFGILVLLSQGSTVAPAPFIYALF